MASELRQILVRSEAVSPLASVSPVIHLEITALCHLKSGWQRASWSIKETVLDLLLHLGRGQSRTGGSQTQRSPFQVLGINEKAVTFNY